MRLKGWGKLPSEILPRFFSPIVSNVKFRLHGPNSARGSGFRVQGYIAVGDQAAVTPTPERSETWNVPIIPSSSHVVMHLGMMNINHIL